jgi:hypothetical protein
MSASHANGPLPLEALGENVVRVIDQIRACRIAGMVRGCGQSMPDTECAWTTCPHPARLAFGSIPRRPAGGAKAGRSRPRDSIAEVHQLRTGGRFRVGRRAAVSHRADGRLGAAGPRHRQSRSRGGIQSSREHESGSPPAPRPLTCKSPKGDMSSARDETHARDEQRASETVSGRLLLLRKGAACLYLVALLLRANSSTPQRRFSAGCFIRRPPCATLGPRRQRFPTRRREADAVRVRRSVQSAPTST